MLAVSCRILGITFTCLLTCCLSGVLPSPTQLRGANLEEMQEWLNILQTPIDETIASSTLYEDALNDLKLADDAPIKGIKRRGLC